ncbi:hypothetical protein [Polycladidibacter hongkongensis]|uniref:hypothetical protein n=1 Tax=Polycladidibacter hongkongensis TaxID=1647556 RepID=UPI00082FF598|nr:hypothetical protein [Pseudovibrio hongkongensis]
MTSLPAHSVILKSSGGRHDWFNLIQPDKNDGFIVRKLHFKVKKQSGATLQLHGVPLQMNQELTGGGEYEFSDFIVSAGKALKYTCSVEHSVSIYAEALPAVTT